MDFSIAAILAQDGITSGAVYALLALALVLVFSVTRVIFIPQGEFVSYGALTIAALQSDRFPQTASLLVALGLVSFVQQAWNTLSNAELRRGAGRTLPLAIIKFLVLPAAVWFATRAFGHASLPMPLQVLLTLAIVTPMGPMIYRIAFEPLAQSSVLVLLMAAFGVHFSLMGLGLVFFGPEGIGTTPLSSASYSLGSLVVTGQSVAVLIVTAILLVLFAIFFGRTLLGKALRACSSNRIGARLVGIPTSAAGQFSFAIAALLGAVSGVLVGPLMTVFYDSGFLIGLKAFVAAIIGGLVSYPLTVVAALGVGFAEALFSFWASNFKEVLVFTLIIPVLAWRSLYAPHTEEAE